MKAGFDRLARDPETGSGLFDAHLLDAAQHEDGAKWWRQLVHGLFDRPPDLLPRDRLLGARFPRVLKPAADGQGFGDLVEGNGGPSLAQPAERLVDDDPRQPGANARLAPETVEMRKGTNIAVLDDLLGLRFIVEKAARKAVKPLVVAAHQRGESRRVSGPHACEQLRFPKILLHPVAPACSGLVTA